MLRPDVGTSCSTASSACGPVRAVAKKKLPPFYQQVKEADPTRSERLHAYTALCHGGQGRLCKTGLRFCLLNGGLRRFCKCNQPFLCCKAVLARQNGFVDAQHFLQKRHGPPSEARKTHATLQTRRSPPFQAQKKRSRLQKRRKLPEKGRGHATRRPALPRTATGTHPAADAQQGLDALQ